MSDKDTREIIGFLALVTVTVVTLLLFRQSPPGPVTRVPVPIREDQAFHPTAGLFDVSRDGSLMVYRRQNEEGVSELCEYEQGV